MKKLKLIGAILNFVCIGVILVSVMLPSLTLILDDTDEGGKLPKALLLEMVSQEKADEYAIDEEEVLIGSFSRKLNAVSFVKNCFTVGADLMKASGASPSGIIIGSSREEVEARAEVYYMSFVFFAAAAFFTAGVVILIVRLYRSLLCLIATLANKKTRSYVESPGILSTIFFYISVQLIPLLAFQVIFDFKWEVFPLRFVTVNGLNYIVLFVIAVVVKIFNEICLNLEKQ